MPPKPKFTKEEIVEAALRLVSREGLGALTTRNLGTELGSSARPIFTVFRNMEQVQQEVRRAAQERLNDYLRRAADFTPAFKEVGMRMIRFAQEEPRLFQLLFMTEGATYEGFDDVFAGLGEMEALCIRLICGDYGLPQQDAAFLFRHTWMNCFALGVLCVTRRVQFTEEEIARQLGEEFMAMLLFLRSDLRKNPPIVPMRESQKNGFEVGSVWKTPEET